MYLVLIQGFIGPLLWGIGSAMFAFAFEAPPTKAMTLVWAVAAVNAADTLSRLCLGRLSIWQRCSTVSDLLVVTPTSTFGEDWALTAVNLTDPAHEGSPTLFPCCHLNGSFVRSSTVNKIHRGHIPVVVGDM